MSEPMKLIKPEFWEWIKLGSNTEKITFFQMAKRDRGKGHGRRWIKAYLSSRPPHVRFVQVTPSDEGAGDPTPFWEKCGFRWMFDVGPNDEDPGEMIIGVNGHPTPKPRPLPWSNDDED